MTVVHTVIFLYCILYLHFYVFWITSIDAVSICHPWHYSQYWIFIGIGWCSRLKYQYCTKSENIAPALHPPFSLLPKTMIVVSLKCKMSVLRCFFVFLKLWMYRSGHQALPRTPECSLWSGPSPNSGPAGDLQQRCHGEGQWRGVDPDFETELILLFPFHVARLTFIFISLRIVAQFAKFLSCCWLHHAYHFKSGKLYLDCWRVALGCFAGVGHQNQS